MLIKVRTLTGKEIELDIEPDYKVCVIILRYLRRCRRETMKFPHIHTMLHRLASPRIASYRPASQQGINTDHARSIGKTGLANQRTSRGERRHPSRAAETDLWWETNGRRKDRRRLRARGREHVTFGPGTERRSVMMTRKDSNSKRRRRPKPKAPSREPRRSLVRVARSKAGWTVECRRTLTIDERMDLPAALHIDSPGVETKT